MIEPGSTTELREKIYQMTQSDMRDRVSQLNDRIRQKTITPFELIELNNLLFWEETIEGMYKAQIMIDEEEGAEEKRKNTSELMREFLKRDGNG